MQFSVKIKIKIDTDGVLFSFFFFSSIHFRFNCLLLKLLFAILYSHKSYFSLKYDKCINIVLRG